jgi:hypothetical protein
MQALPRPGIIRFVLNARELVNWNDRIQYENLNVGGDALTDNVDIDILC